MVTGKCQCGKCTVGVRKPGGIRTVRCHCSHCRKANAGDTVTQGKYGINQIDWVCNVSMQGPTEATCTTFAPFGIPCPMWCVRRHRCKDCGTSVANFGYGGLTSIAVVNVACIDRGLPEGQHVECDFDNFYDSGLKEEAPSSTTYHSDCGSILGLLFQVVCIGVPSYGSGHCCCFGAGTSTQIQPA